MRNTFGLSTITAMLLLAPAAAFGQVRATAQQQAIARSFELAPAGAGQQMGMSTMKGVRSAAGIAAHGASDSRRAQAPWMPPVLQTDVPLVFMLDDGSYEGVTTVYGTNGQVTLEIAAVYVNRFTPPQWVQDYTINTVSILWPTVDHARGNLAGLQVAVVAYYDADGDGDPSNAVVVSQSLPVFIINQVGVWENYAVDFTVPGAGDVYVGFYDYWARPPQFYSPLLYPAARDEGSDQRRSYISYASNAYTDVFDLGNNDHTGLAGDIQADSDGNWMIRATATATLADPVFCSGFELAGGPCEAPELAKGDGGN